MSSGLPTRPTGCWAASAPSMRESVVSIHPGEMLFTRALPESALETAQMVKTLEGMVPDSVLLSQLPFLDGDDTEPNQKP